MPDGINAAAQADTVFISHAMPEDTDFGAWLAVQLARQGYSVWSEAAQLIGGERFWRDIDEAFRLNRIAKAVVVVSPSFCASHRKEGMEAELTLALRTARKLADKGRTFVQPLLTGGIDDDEIPVELATRNAINFSDSWANGLSRLLKALERDGIPRSGPPIEQLGDWVRDRSAGGRLPVARPQPLASNTCPITSFPERIWFYSLQVALDFSISNKLAALVGQHVSWPIFEHGRLIGTFAPPDEFLAALPPELGASRRGSVASVEFMRDGAKNPAVSRKDAGNHVKGMLRKAWDQYCEARGLLPMRNATGANCWFHPGDRPGKYRFTDVTGQSRTKAMHGIKNKNASEESLKIRVHWHYAPSAKIVLGEDPHVMLVPHVAFTHDGRALLGDAEKAHRIRRSFCRSWWNEQWRTLHLGYLASIRGEEDNIVVQVAPGQAIRVGGVANAIECPVSYDVPTRPSRGGLVNAAATDEAAPEEIPDEDTAIPPADLDAEWAAEDEA